MEEFLIKASKARMDKIHRIFRMTNPPSAHSPLFSPLKILSFLPILSRILKKRPYSAIEFH